MKRSNVVALVVLFAEVVVSLPTYAALNTETTHGTQRVEIPVAGRKAESCFIPAHLSSGVYSPKDVQDEQNLCAIQEGVNAAVCPKTNSTNPGLNFYGLPQGKIADAVEAAACNGDDVKMIAKYKLSASCSYAPSIIGYYHISRLLGGIANIPPVVLRTFDRQNHIALGHLALTRTKPADIIHQTWSGLVANLSAGAASHSRDQLMTSSVDQSYGALLKNTKKEQFYKEFWNGGANNVARAVAFRDHNPTMALLKNPAPVSSLVGRDLNAANLQKLVQMRDASNMILLDTMLNQQDRFGNIDYITVNYAQVDGKIVSAKDGGVAVKEMILKDNDCGVAKDNVAKKALLLSRVAHMDPEVYHRVQKLNATIDGAELKTFFAQDLIFTASDFANVRKNLSDIATTLKKQCAAGTLKLDLDLSAHFSGAAPTAVSCD